MTTGHMVMQTLSKSMEQVIRVRDYEPDLERYKVVQNFPVQEDKNEDSNYTMI